MAWTSEEYLAHHGILGQKWGKQNGPPYPLGSGDHSASEKRAGWRKSLKSKRTQRKEEKRALSEREKAAKRRAAVTAVGLGLGAATAARVLAENKETGRNTTHRSAESYIKDGSIDALQEQNKKLAAIQSYNKLTGNKNRLEAAADDANKLNQQLDKLKNSIKVEKYDGPTHKRMKLDDMTDDDMRRIINREKLEIEYSNLFGEKIEPVKSGEEKVRDALEIAGGIAAAAGTALTIALMIQKLKAGVASAKGGSAPLTSK